MSVYNVITIDLGATSGRIMLVTWDGISQKIALKELHRFTNQLVHCQGFTCWDLEKLACEIINSLMILEFKIDSIGIDTWGIDYVLLDKMGSLVTPPISYRDHHDDGIMVKIQKDLGKEYLYNRTGIQFLPFNTIYQLYSLRQKFSEKLKHITHLLLIPDYFHYLLTGKFNWEYTNASTTQLVNLITRDWDQDLLDYIDIPSYWVGTLCPPGNTIGFWHGIYNQRIPVISVATHDTASAVVSIPLFDKKSVYLISGTWSLMGIESTTPYNNTHAMSLNITNEGGIDNTYLVLKNIMGMWIINRIMHELNINNLSILLIEAMSLEPFKFLINPNDKRFINPVSMIETISVFCNEHHQIIPKNAGVLIRCILDSLAMCYYQTLLELSELLGYKPNKLYIVGGGSQNSYLNQLTANCCQLFVYAGLIEASVLGNAGCQLMAAKEIPNIFTWRQLLMQNFIFECFVPQPIKNFNNYWQYYRHICTL